MSGMSSDNDHKDIERSFKRPSGWARAFAGIAAALALVIVGVLAAGALSAGQTSGPAAASALSQVVAEDGSEVIADNETPLADAAESARASEIGGGMRILIVSGIMVTVAAFGFLMRRENRSIATMMRRGSGTSQKK